MRLCLVVSVSLLLLTSVLADIDGDATDKDQEEEEYEDIAVAESQDIAHSQVNPTSEDDFGVEVFKSRPRGKKRRRRLRNRPRSTTPSFIEKYNPQETVTQEKDVPLADREQIMQRRRPPKRRRRPIPHHSEYDIQNPDLGMITGPLDQYNEHHRPRNPQRRRRRKGGRKRMRNPNEFSQEINNTHEESGRITNQNPEIVMKSNNYSSYDQDTRFNSHDDTTVSTQPPAFTTKEITEINHKLESLANNQPPFENDYQRYGSGVFSFFQTISTDPSSQNIEDNQIIGSSTTPKDFSWMNRFQSNSITTVLTPTDANNKDSIINLDLEKITKQNSQRTTIKNIEQIIENRKNLFSTSRRLPLTSALIRQRLRPKKLQNFTIPKESVGDNTISTVIRHGVKVGKKVCQTVECALNENPIATNNIVPSGFLTMPEILTTADLIQKTLVNEESAIPKTTFKTLVSSLDPNHKSSNLIIVTPSTLAAFQDEKENGLPSNQVENKVGEIEDVVVDTLNTSRTLPTNSNRPALKLENKTFISDLTEHVLEFIPTTTKISQNKHLHEFEITKTLKPGDNTEEIIYTTTPREVSSESDKFKLDQVDTSNVNDEILELIMDEMGKARVKRILELRNMTLSELIAHRERGAGHFSDFGSEDFSNRNNTKLNVKDNLRKLSQIQRKVGLEQHDTDDEEQTEKMIVEKAKDIINKYKRGDEVFSSTAKYFSQIISNFGERVKTKGADTQVPILELRNPSVIQFPDDSVMGAFPKFMFDIVGKQGKPSFPPLEDKPYFTESLNKPRDIKELNKEREPRVFESMPRFSSETKNKASPEISPYPNWQKKVSETIIGKNLGFPGISREIMIVAPTKKNPSYIGDTILLDEGEDHNHRNHMLGRNIETQDEIDEDYPDEKKVPTGVKSAITASAAILGLAIFGFLAVLISCKIRQRRARLRIRRDFLNEQLAEDFRSSQRSLSPVIRKSMFNTGIQANMASNRHYYLWRTLRKTFQYE